MQKINIEIEKKSKIWQKITKIDNFIEKTCQKLIKHTELAKFKGEIALSISLVSNPQIQKINHNFRGKNKPTDILSFPFTDPESIRQTQGFLYLGDIILSLEIPRKEAINSEKTFHDHLTHLLLHSILHLIGFDHEKPAEANKMEALEIKILKKLNIKNPYL